MWVKQGEAAIYSLLMLYLCEIPRGKKIENWLIYAPPVSQSLVSSGEQQLLFTAPSVPMLCLFARLAPEFPYHGGFHA